MIDIIRTVFATTYEYERRYGKRPVLFINRPFDNALMADMEIRRNCLHTGLDNMILCGYPAKLVLDDSNEMHFWIGEQKPIYGEVEPLDTKTLRTEWDGPKTKYDYLFMNKENNNV